MNIFRKTAIAAVLCLINFASNAENVESTVIASGSSSALSLNAYIAPTSNFIGNNSKLYLAIVLGNSVYFYSDTAGFVPYAGGLAALVGSNAAEAPPVRAITKSTETISLAGDATAVVGADVYVGYGTNFAELISSARYAKKYTITNGIKVFSTSYENAKSQPQLHMPQRGASNLVTTAFGWADFFQTGSKTLFTATYRYEAWIQTMEQATGDSKYLSDFDFWNKNGDGTYTKILSFPNAGCLHPRKAVVADFNQDGYPDLFISCHGYDTPPYPGERSKLVMSNGHGGFTVRDVGTVGYWHTASAADVNGDGYPDIVVSNQKDDPHTFFLINNRDGTFSADKTRIVGLNQVNFAMELVDVDGDGNIDLIGGYDESNQYVDYRTITRVMYGDLLGHFGARSDIIPSIKNRGIVLDFTVVTNNGVRGIFVCRTSDSTSLEGFYKSSTLQWVDIKTMASSIVLDETKNIFPSNPFWWTNANKNGQNGVTPMLDDYSTFTQFISH